MEEYDEEVRAVAARLQRIRSKMLLEQPFYAALLMHLKFALDKATPTLYTDGERIAFSPDFIVTLSDDELEFLLMHEVLHVALGHCAMRQDEYDHLCFDMACDIIVNSNILHAFGDDKKRICVDGTESVHCAPNGSEGWKYNVQEMYAMLRPFIPTATREADENVEDVRDGEDSKDGEDGEDDKDSKDGEDSKDGKDGKDGEDDKNGKNGEDGEDGEDGKDGGDSKVGKEGKGGKDGKDGKDDEYGGDGKNGKGCKGGKVSEDCGWADDGDEEDGAEDTGSSAGDSADGEKDSRKDGGADSWDCTESVDDHTFWNGDGDHEESAVWQEWIMDAVQAAEKTEAMLSVTKASRGCGVLPLGILRLLRELLQARTDWKTILNDFVQEEVNDYSFSPPDRRFDDSPFFLPDFNEKDTSVKNIVFLVDTSESVSGAMIQRTFSELKGAIDQFNGKLEGFLGFFDSKVYDLLPFSEQTDLTKIIPRGGGGTSFENAIRGALEQLKDDLPECMVCLTDGCCPFPDESITLGVPFLWMLLQEKRCLDADCDTENKIIPPWGKVARITLE